MTDHSWDERCAATYHQGVEDGRGDWWGYIVVGICIGLPLGFLIARWAAS